MGNIYNMFLVLMEEFSMTCEYKFFSNLTNKTRLNGSVADMWLKEALYFTRSQDFTL